MRDEVRMLNRKGVTLVELLIVLAILGIVLGIVYGIFITAKRTQSAEEQLVELTQEARGGLQQMISELRMAGAQKTGVLSPCTESSKIKLIDMTAVAVEFEGDVDLDGALERIRYEWNSTGKILYRYDREITDRSQLACNASITTLSATGYNKQPVAFSIEGLTLAYYDSGNSLIALPPASEEKKAEVTKITLTIQAKGAKPPNSIKTLVVEVKLPNFGTEKAGVDTTPPATPTGVTAVNRRVCGYLGITWNANIETDLAGYKVYWKLSGASEWQGVKTVGLVTSTQTGGMTNGSTYEVAVAAFDTSGNMSGLSTTSTVALNDDINPQAFVWTAYPTSGTAASGTQLNSILDAIEASSDTSSSLWVKLKWSAFADTDKDGKPVDADGQPYPVIYDIERYNPLTSAWSVIQSGYQATPNSQGFIEYIDTTLPTKCVQYKYRVRAKESVCGKASSYSNEPDGNGSASGADSPTNGVTNTRPSSNAAPPPPSPFSVSGGARLIYLEWTPPSDPSYDNVMLRVKRATTSDDSNYPSGINDGTKVCDPCTSDTNGDGVIRIQHARQTGDFDNDVQRDAGYTWSQIENGYYYFYAAFPKDRCGNYGTAAYAKAKAKICNDGTYPGATEAPRDLNALGICEDVRLQWKYPTYAGREPGPGDVDYEGDPTPWDIVFYNIYRCKIETSDCTPGTKINSSSGLSHIDSTSAGLVEGSFYKYQVTSIDCKDPTPNESGKSNLLPPSGSGGISPGKITGSGETDADGKFIGNAKGGNFNKVEFDVKNSSASTLKLRGVTLSWKYKTSARIYKVSLDSSVLWQAASTSGIGTCDSITGICTATVPGQTGETNNFPRDITGLSTPKMTLEFRTSSGSVQINMKGAEITLTPNYSNELTLSYNCSTHNFTVKVTQGPTIGTVYQNKPASNTEVSTTVPPDSNHTVEAADSVKISTTVTPPAGTTLSNSYLYYAVTSKSQSTAPIPVDPFASPAVSTNVAGVTYSRTDMTLEGGNYEATISANPDRRIWFYIVAKDSKGALSISPSTQPEEGFSAYVYDQKSQ